MMRTLIFLFTVLMVSCQSTDKKLPILSYKINANGEKQNYKITYSNFTDQNGKSVTTKTIKNKILIANFFFTRCPSICPPMRTELIELAKTFNKEKDVLLISHSIDPKNDTIEVLKNYSEATGISDSKWVFLRSSEAQTKLQALQFMTNFKPNEDGTDFYHSSYVALLDKNQNIRGFYNSLILEEMLRLKADIKNLLTYE